MKNQYKYFLLAFILFPFLVEAQTKCSILVIVEQELEFDVKNWIRDSNTLREVDFYIFTDAYSVDDIADSLNRLLNYSTKVDKSHFYQVIVGSNNFFSVYTNVHSDLIAAKHFVGTDSMLSETDQFKTSHFNDVDFNAIVNDLRSKYKFHFMVDNIKRRSEEDITRDKEKGFGLKSGYFSFISSEIEEGGYLPASYFDYGVTYFKLFKNKWRWNTDLSFTFKKPNPQKVAQEQITSQIDISSILSGASVEEEVYLNFDVIGRFGFQINSDLLYYFNYKNKFNPYGGIGIGIGALASFKGSIDTTITLEIDGSGGFDRSSLSGDADRDLSESDFNQTTLMMPSVNLSLGFQQELGRRLSLDMSAKALIDVNSFRGRSFANRFTIQAGLLYRLTGKRKVIYNYFPTSGH